MECINCKKTFTQRTLDKYGGNICGRCSSKLGKLDPTTEIFGARHLEGSRNCQAHGFIFEMKVIELLRANKSLKYTDEFGAAIEAEPPIPIQIKCIKEGSEICMGDYYRVSSIPTDFYLIVGFWNKGKSDITQIFVDYIDHKLWTKYNSYPYIDELRMDVANISNSRSDDKKWDSIRTKHAEQWGNDRGTQLRMKRDHKFQKRVQFAIRNTFYTCSSFINFVTKSSIQPSYFDSLKALCRKLLVR